MWKNVSWTERMTVIGQVASAVALCLAATAFLMYPVLGELIVR